MTFKKKCIDLSSDFLGSEPFASFISSCNKNIQEIFPALVQLIRVIFLFFSKKKQTFLNLG